MLSSSLYFSMQMEQVSEILVDSSLSLNFWTAWTTFPKGNLPKSFYLASLLVAILAKQHKTMQPQQQIKP